MEKVEKVDKARKKFKEYAFWGILLTVGGLVNLYLMVTRTPWDPLALLIGGLLGIGNVYVMFSVHQELYGIYREWQDLIE